MSPRDASGQADGAAAFGTEPVGGTEAEYEVILESISDAVFITDDAGALTFVCPNVASIFGRSAGEVLALGNVRALLDEGLFEPAALQEAGELRNLEADIRNRGGQSRNLLVNVKRVAIKGGTRLYSCRDVTDRRRAEEQLHRREAELAHAARLSVMGELATTLAHELNQPLGAICAYADACQAKMRRGEVSGLARRIEEIALQAEQAAGIVRRVRDFCRKRAPVRQRVDVNGVIQDAIGLIEAELRKNDIRLTLALGEGLPRVSGDPIQLQQVVLNLARNAVDAIERARTTRRALVVSSGAADAGTVAVCVRDDGVGLEDEALARVFEPFYSTKAEGMGMGLSISRTIVAAHAGKLWATRNGGGGATFHMVLPVADKEYGDV
jgi:two-component system sensor histidine kinase TtrS